MMCCTLLIALFGVLGTALHKIGLRPASPLAWRPDAAAPAGLPTNWLAALNAYWSSAPEGGMPRW